MSALRDRDAAAGPRDHTGSAQASPLVQAALAAISPPLLHLTLALSGQPVQWTGIAQLLSVSGARLRLDLTAGITAASLVRLAMVSSDASIKPEPVAVFPATPSAVTAARQAFPGSAIGSGTRHFFAQLNRMEDVGPADFLGFTVCPIVHSAEAVSVMSLRGDAGVLDETVDGRLLRHPTFFVLAQLARLKTLRAVTVSNLAGVVALAGACNGRDDWLIANLTSQTVDLTVSNAMPARVMDAAAWQAYVSGQAESPWRVLCMKHAGVMQLDAFAIALK